jgi:hypothetical protein
MIIAGIDLSGYLSICRELWQQFTDCFFTSVKPCFGETSYTPKHVGHPSLKPRLNLFQCFLLGFRHEEQRHKEIQQRCKRA